jgi:hypothetical protein
LHVAFQDASYKAAAAGSAEHMLGYGDTIWNGAAHLSGWRLLVRCHESEVERVIATASEAAHMRRLGLLYKNETPHERGRDIVSMASTDTCFSFDTSGHKELGVNHRDGVAVITGRAAALFGYQ